MVLELPCRAGSVLQIRGMTIPDTAWHRAGLIKYHVPSIWHCPCVEGLVMQCYVNAGRARPGVGAAPWPGWGYSVGAAPWNTTLGRSDGGVLRSDELGAPVQCLEATGSRITHESVWSTECHYRIRRDSLLTIREVIHYCIRSDSLPQKTSRVPTQEGPTCLQGKVITTTEYQGISEMLGIIASLCYLKTPAAIHWWPQCDHRPMLQKQRGPG